MAKEYKIIQGRWVEEILDELNKMSLEGWTVTYMLQEHAYTKVVIEKEKNG